MKDEIIGETLLVPSKRLIQGFGRNAVKHRKIDIEHHFLAPDQKDELRDVFRLQDDGHVSGEERISDSFPASRRRKGKTEIELVGEVRSMRAASEG